MRGDWENPYLTMSTDFEAKIVEVFGELAEKGYIYRGLKPVLWCATCETALADAEVEYEQHTSNSIYVRFPLEHDPNEARRGKGGRRTATFSSGRPLPGRSRPTSRWRCTRMRSTWSSRTPQPARDIWWPSRSWRGQPVWCLARRTPKADPRNGPVWAYRMTAGAITCLEALLAN